MTRARDSSQGHERGIDRLPSGALRVRVYAGIDPVSKRRHFLTEVIPAGPKAAELARGARDRLVLEVQERRNPRTAATVSQLIDRYLDQFNGAPRTLELYRSYVRTHIGPLIGDVKVAALDAEMLDSFYAELRRCRGHCTGQRSQVQHRTPGEHQCDQRCRRHTCRPLGASAIRHMHFILSGAYRRAVRWRWVSVSPLTQATPPAAPTPNPKPPSCADAARIVNHAWRDPDWGTLVWVTMTTGARRGELCALRWSHVELDPERAVLWLRRGISHTTEGWIESDLKTHQQRRVALDPETIAVLTEHRDRCQARAAALGLSLHKDAFVFSPKLDGSRFLAPSSLTQRYDRLAKRLDVETTFHKLRHYSATELIAAGVDIRTVAGRLGHGGGGTTTLKAYTAWVAEADQRAAKNIGGRMPERPVHLTAAERAKTEPQSPYERIAAQLRRDIRAGLLGDGELAPSAKKVAVENDVSVATAHRAMRLLKTWGLIASSHGRRTIVVRPRNPECQLSDDTAEPDQVATPDPHGGRELLDFEVRWRGAVAKKFTTEANPKDATELRQLLVDAIRRHGRHEFQIGEYEMEIRYSGTPDLLTTFVASIR